MTNLGYFIPVTKDGKYIIHDYADANYYFDYELNEQNLKSHPPKLYTESDFNEVFWESEIFLENSGSYVEVSEIIKKQVLVQIQ